MGLKDEMTTRGNPGNATPSRNLCSVTFTVSNSGSIDLCYSARHDESSAADGQLDIEPVPASRLDEARDSTLTGRYRPKFDDLDRRFLCALEAVDAKNTDHPLTPPPIETLDCEHIASGISLVDYA